MNTRITDYRRLLDDCIKLYEKLESTMDEIDLLVTDIRLATEDIHESFETIDYRMERCTERLRWLVNAAPSKGIDYQGSVTASDPEAGEA